MDIQDLINIYEGPDKGIVHSVGYHLHQSLFDIANTLGGNEAAAQFFRAVERAEKPTEWKGDVTHGTPENN